MGLENNDAVCIWREYWFYVVVAVNWPCRLIQLIEAYCPSSTLLAILGYFILFIWDIKSRYLKPQSEITKSNVPKFYEGFLLQWLNPKAWIACVSRGIPTFKRRELCCLFNVHQIYSIICLFLPGLLLI